MNEGLEKQFLNELSEYLDKVEHESKINFVSTINKQKTYDIIITVFNGLDSLKKCIKSLLKHTSKKHSIYIYNDKSTDSLVLPWLDKLARDYAHIHICHHQTNIGYLRNVNFALTKINNDCIILNSDTKVTRNWLQELDRVAANKKIAIVCPLSNNATILSLSKTSLKNVKKLEQFSGCWYPIPTAVGFCMLIKKEIIKEFGGFDLIYSPGYGEECDYSLRVRNKGYSIACAPAAFVFHEGSMSFLSKALKIQKTHEKILKLRWTKYENEVKQFSESNPIRQIEERLFEMNRKKETILHVIHGLNFKGGVELFTKELIDKLSAEFNHIILIPSQKKLNWKFSEIINDELDIRIINFQFVNINLNSIICKKSADLYKLQLDIMFLQVIKSRDFKLVHFHSLVGLGSLLWPKICHKQGVEYLISCHDHFFGCHNHNLLSSRTKQFCGNKYSNSKKLDCLDCLSNLTEYNRLPTERYIDLRNIIWLDILRKASSIIIPNIYMKRLLCSFIGEEKTNIHVVEPFFHLANKNYISRRENSLATLNIAFLGNFNFSKGAGVFLKLNKKLQNQDINWHIYGPIHEDYKNNSQLENINCYGSYNRKNLKNILSKIDLVILPSLFPETYSITLTETWENEIPAIATGIGSLKERIIDGFNGYLFPVGQIDYLAEIIKTKFLNNPRNIKNLIDNISKQSKVNLFSDVLMKKLYYGIKQVTDIVPMKNDMLDLTLQIPSYHASINANKWLNAELTLEAELDWRLPEALIIIVLNGPIELVKESIKSCKTYAKNSKVYLLSEISLEIFKASNILCFLKPGQKLNDNFGNWINLFKTSRSRISTCNYMLYDSEDLLYAPVFFNEFDPFDYIRNKSRVSSVLLNQTTFEDVECIYQNIIQSNNLNFIFDGLLSQYKDAIYHFPYLACLYHDVQWAKDWKLDKKSEVYFENNLKSVSIVIQTSASFLKLENLLKIINSQVGIEISNIYILSKQIIEFDSDENVKFVQIKDSMNLAQNIKIMNEVKDTDAFLFLNDNVFIKSKLVIKPLLNCLQWYGIEAISPAFNVENESIFMQKIGKGKAISGWGKVFDTTFDGNNLPRMTQVIDEDFVLLSFKAVALIAKQEMGFYSYYNSMKISKYLLSNDCSLSILKLSNIEKCNLPSFINDSEKPEELEKQRLSLFHSDKAYFLNSRYYSYSYDSQETIDLDINFGVFKTPKNLPRVIAYAHDTWASGFYRVQSPITSLVVTNKISCNFLPFAKQNKTASYYEINKQNPTVLLLHNFLNDEQLNALNYYKKYLSIPIVLSFDDLLTDIPSYNEFKNTNFKDVDKRIELALKYSDKLIVSTEYLANKFNHLHSNIVVINNMLSRQLWLNDFTKKKNKLLRIGWAGAAQHKDDLDWLVMVVKKTTSFIQWVFYGSKPQGLDLSDIEYHPHTSFSQYQSKLQSLHLDIAIAPLVDNEFNKAKSNLKLLEYGALKIPVICSAIMPYLNSPAIKLANNTQQWTEAIKYLAYDTNVRQQLGNAMYEWVVDNYILDDNLNLWVDALYLK